MAFFSHSECKTQGGCQEAKQGPKMVQSVGFILGMIFLGVAVMASVVLIGNHVRTCTNQRQGKVSTAVSG